MDSFAVDRLADGRYVLAYASTGEQIGLIRGSVTPFITRMDGQPHVILAGTQEHHRHRYAVVEGTPSPIYEEVWMAWPILLRDGMTITVVGQDAAGRELFRLTTEPLHANRKPHPLFGPSWTGYAPML